ncbi:LLM class F420-dependent oxidoreductase [Dermatobacter hominis]|uniref:LLM class F420-dependent oxidoreductase n=1 Tax=Dermatobacter hominis TaxID=2884263 RepID=UPI001D1028DC|nr:LLM class F420-dependent oxidoreductase [Dermatobacter hominis]UDY35321.1 LLM class F420-dependent oxidoreductase [Dermatobacter hominis]
MEFGIAFANTLQFTEREGLVTLAQSAEAAGFDSLWTVEHVIYPDGYESEYPYDKSGKMAADASSPIPDPLIWLAFVAAATTTLRLGTGILILPQRNPLVLAKEVATLDRLSGGRVELGIGVGWLKEEFDALGVPFERRGARTDEWVDVMRAVWADDHVDFHGEFASFTGASVNPKPAGDTVPITVGGHSPAAARRAGRLGDGFFPAKGDIPELVDIMRQAAADAGRDPSAITVSTGSAGVFGDDPAAAVEELASQGVDRVIVPAFAFWRDPEATIAEFGERVITPTR